MEINRDTIQPVKNYLLIEIDEQKETSSGLLLAEDGGYNLPTVGKIINTGDNASYAIGQVVMFRKYSADEIKITTAEREERFWLLEDSEVIAVVGKKKTSKKYEQIELKNEVEIKSKNKK